MDTEIIIHRQFELMEPLALPAAVGSKEGEDYNLLLMKISRDGRDGYLIVFSQRGFANPLNPEPSGKCTQAGEKKKQTGWNNLP